MSVKDGRADADGFDDFVDGNAMKSFLGK
jgi:hypothetical protein